MERRLRRGIERDLEGGLERWFGEGSEGSLGYFDRLLSTTSV